MKRTKADNKYKWDFSDLYKNEKDWEKDLKAAAKLGERMKEFQGKLNDRDTFLEYLRLDTELDSIFNKLVIYTHLGDVDQSNTLYQELEGLMMNVYQKMRIETSFIAPELKAIGEDTIMSWLESDENLKRYELGFKNFFKQTKHILDEHDEELLSMVARSRGAIGGMYDTLAYADRQEVEIDYKGTKQPLTNSLFMEIMEDTDPIKDQQLRIDASKLFGKNLSDNKHSFAKIYEGIMQGATESINIRGYETALEASLDGDNIPTDIYLKLLEVGKKYIKPFKDYNLLVKEKYGFDKFYPTDRQLKMVKEYNRTFTVEEAQELIINALSVLGDEYMKNLKQAWSDNHIDYYEDTNKRDGAYSTGGNGVDPIILMNWDDKLNSVNTLAHESGHSVHTLFADQNQPYPLSEYPIILAEVASTINEHLLFDYMYKNAATKDEKIYLLQQRIFDLVSTFYRQIQFADFEYQAHIEVQQGKPQTADTLATLFEETQQEYGYDVFDKVNLDSKGTYGWPRISHFFHSPFYVYKYAIDVTASYKLFEDIKNGNIETTINFLKAGGSKDPLDVMMDAGIDFHKDSTYKPLINAIEDMVKELEELIK